MRSTQNCLGDTDVAGDLEVEERGKCSVAVAPIRLRRHGISKVFKLYVRVIAMMGKLVPRVTTGKRGKKYWRKGMGGMISRPSGDEHLLASQV